MMNERRDILERTKGFALRIVRLYASLPKTTEAQVIVKPKFLAELIKEADELTAILVTSAKTVKQKRRKA